MPLLPETDKETGSDKQLPAEFPTFVSSKIATESYENLQRVAVSKKTTTNELLLVALFLAVDQWQKQQGWQREGRKIRIVVPINIRDIGDRKCPACNRMSFVQLDRGDRDLQNPDGLIWGINYELGFIRRFGFEKTLNIGLRGVAFVPGMLKWLARRRKRRATTLLTNLGKPFDRLRLPMQDGLIVCGEMLLQDVELVAPWYDQMPASFLVSGYAGRFSITLNYDSRELEASQAEQLLEQFQTQIRIVSGIV